jgi:uncharacterized protein YdaU (DUF1376 family)
MKFYRHDPDAFLAGTGELNFEQRGAYITLINLLYSRDGAVPDDDVAVGRMLQCDPRLWRRLKSELMALGKLRSNGGLLTANGVDRTLLLTEVRSNLARHQANVRWENYRKAKQNNVPLMQHCNAPISDNKKEEDSCPVNSGDKSDNSETEPENKKENKNIISNELSELVRRKQEFDKAWR